MRVFLRDKLKPRSCRISIIKDLFTYAVDNNFKRVPHTYYEEIEKDHGRIENRSYWLVSNETDSENQTSIRWPGLKGLGMTSKVGIATKRKKAGWDCQYLAKILECK